MKTASENISVLVVDDDDDARSLAALGVKAAGFTVVEADSGEQALKFIQQFQPDLAVIDRMMPGISGPELCSKIKADKEGAYIPVLMLTACDQLNDKVAALEGGVDDYLTKPFHVEELQARLKALLRMRELNLHLRAKNEELLKMQEALLQKERQILVLQLAGTAAHKLGQPLSAILLNCHLLERLPPDDQRYRTALTALREDAQRMAKMIEALKSTDPGKKSVYHGTTEILEIPEELQPEK